MKWTAFLIFTSALASVACQSEEDYKYSYRTKTVWPQHPVYIESALLRREILTTTTKPPITTPKVPLLYVEDVLITSERKTWVIQLEMDRLQGFFRNDCNGHNVTIFDGATANDANEVDIFCAKHMPVVRSTGPSMVLRMNSTKDGISFKAFAVDPGLTEGDVVGIAIAAIVVVAAIIIAVILFAFRDSVCYARKAGKYQPG